jgi:hypothetical protein
VGDNTTTTFWARTTDQAGNNSSCSTTSITYTENSTLPEAPTFTDTDPNSPANDNNPRIKGSAPANTTVTLYTEPDCTGLPVAFGSDANFGSPGLSVSVGDNTTTTFWATATDTLLNTSPCSTSSITYVEDSTAPAAPSLTGTDPNSPANDNNPKIKGTAEAGSTVNLYTSSDCTGSPAQTGSSGSFASPGLTVTVTDDTTTTYRATATDQAGNSATATTSYTVLAWTFLGFYQPTDMPVSATPVWNTVKNGSTVPLKFELFAGPTELTSTSSVWQPLQAQQLPCTGGTEDTVELTATGATTLRYDSQAGQFIYNWQTPKKPGYCYRVTVVAQDGSSKTAYFRLK